MALELFRPFVIGKLLKESSPTTSAARAASLTRECRKYGQSLKRLSKTNMYSSTARRLSTAWVSRHSSRVLIEGNAIQLHPLVCPAFNADFDGDQMAVHVPLSPEAQAEAREIMAAPKNILKPGNSEPVVAGKLLDILLGTYWMTKEVVGAKGEGLAFSSPNSAILAYDYGRVGFQAKIKVLPSEKEKYAQFGGALFETTVGRLLFNTTFPTDYPFINAPIDKKGLCKTYR